MKMTDKQHQVSALCEVTSQGSSLGLPEGKISIIYFRTDSLASILSTLHAQYHS